VATTFTQLSPNIGVEVTGLSGNRLVDRRVADDSLAALEQHGVVVYRQADLSDEGLVAFSRLLGQVVILPMGTHPGHPEISLISRDPSRSSLAAYQEGTFFWHLDGATRTVPEKATLLTAREITDDDSGDTEFANTYAAYEALPAGQKAQVGGMRVVHSFAASQIQANPNPSETERAAWDRGPAKEHPLVWTRRNGRKSMLLGATAAEVVGRSSDEGRYVLNRLLDWATQPQFVLRHRWRRGDLVVWDNTGMLHRARPYSSTSARLMHRTTLAGEEGIE
jgi:alpha-ketoglutarate-dependent taurine dioxygenase